MTPVHRTAELHFVLEWFDQAGSLVRRQEWSEPPMPPVMTDRQMLDLEPRAITLRIEHDQAIRLVSKATQGNVGNQALRDHGEQ